MGYTYTSLISDGELIQGDSSDITIFSTDMAEDLSGGDWEAKYTIRESFETAPIVEKALPLNDNVSQGVPINGGFVHQILPADSELLTPNKKYMVSIQISNASIGYNAEVAQFKLKIKNQGVN